MSCPAQIIELDQNVLSALLDSFHKDVEHLQRVLQILCRPPLYSTLRVDTHALDMPRALDQLQEHFSQQCSQRDMECFDISAHPCVPDCVVVGNRGPLAVQELSQAVVVDLACGMAVLRGAHVFVQGILGAPKGLKIGDWVSVYADLDKKCLKGFAGSYTGRSFFLGNGISSVARSDVFSSESQQSGLAISMVRPIFEAPSFSDLPLAWAFPQNLPSIVCVHALAPQPGETILDMCAAPGGKTSHIAALMENSGTLIALEKSAGRTERLRAMLAKMGHSRVQCFHFDATKACTPVDRPDEPPGQGCPPFPPASFDRILLDGPCSALGQRPCHINKMSLSQLKSFPIIQERLLATAARLLRPGGTLVYSTCTICREENEDQVAKVLAQHTDLELVDVPYSLASSGLPTDGLTPAQCAKLQRFDPSSLLNKQSQGASFKADLDTTNRDTVNTDTIGFFIAKFRKKFVFDPS